MNPDHPFAPKYARAREIGYLRMADQLLDISDGDGTDAAKDSAQVQRDRLRADTRKWLLSKMLPKVFGDRLAVEASASPEMMRLDDERSRREMARRLIYILDGLMKKAQEAREQRQSGPRLIEAKVGQPLNVTEPFNVDGDVDDD